MRLVRPVLGLDRVCDERDESLLVFFVKPRPLSVGVEFEEPKFAVLPDEVEASESVAGFVHEALDGPLVLRRQRTSWPRLGVRKDRFSGVFAAERVTRCACRIRLAVDIDDRHLLFAINSLLHEPGIAKIKGVRINFLHEEHLALADGGRCHRLDDPSPAL